MEDWCHLWRLVGTLSNRILTIRVMPVSLHILLEWTDLGSEQWTRLTEFATGMTSFDLPRKLCKINPHNNNNNNTHTHFPQQQQQQQQHKKEGPLRQSISRVAAWESLFFCKGESSSWGLTQQIEVQNAPNQICFDFRMVVLWEVNFLKHRFRLCLVEHRVE